MKQIKVCLVTLALLTSACEQNDVERTVPQENAVNESVAEESPEVAIDDVSAVASSFFAESGKAQATRGGDYEISVVYDEKGDKSLYVVNYANEGGFIIVSPTKNFTPVLAYSESGNYDVNGIKPFGLFEWQASIISEVRKADRLPADSTSKYRAQWSRYVKSGTAQDFAAALPAPASLEDDMMKAQMILQDSVMMWISRQGHEVFSVGHSDNEKVNEETEGIVEGGIYPLYQEEWDRLSLILKRPVEKAEVVENFVPTKWNQTMGFNASYPLNENGVHYYAGCGPVAAGQIMRYYRYPSNINWDDMPYDYATTTTSDLLYDIAERANATYELEGTGTKIDNIATTLQQFGYSCKREDHSYLKAWDDISNRRPVYMRAVIVGTDSGHAWIASGGKDTYSYVSYELFTFREKFLFSPIYTYHTNQSASTYFYMNWGWGGLYDGNYLDWSIYSDNHLNIPGQGATCDREDIYNIMPK